MDPTGTHAAGSADNGGTKSRHSDSSDDNSASCGRGCVAGAAKLYTGQRGPARRIPPGLCGFYNAGSAVAVRRAHRPDADYALTILCGHQHGAFLLWPDVDPVSFTRTLRTPPLAANAGFLESASDGSATRSAGWPRSFIWRNPGQCFGTDLSRRPCPGDS